MNELVNADIHSKMLCAENSADVLSGQCMAENSLLFSNNQNDSEFLYNKTPSFMLTENSIANCMGKRSRFSNKFDENIGCGKQLSVHYIILFIRSYFLLHRFSKERFSRNAEIVLKERKALIEVLCQLHCIGKQLKKLREIK